MSKSVPFSLKEISEIVKILESHKKRRGFNKLQETLLKRFIRAGKPIKVSSAKGKGRELQQRVCRTISEVLNIPYDQSSDQCEIHSREMGQAGTDVVLRGEALKRFPFSIECKNSESFNFLETIKQASQNIYPDTYWLIVHKRKSLKFPIAIIDWDVFAMIISEWSKLK